MSRERLGIVVREWKKSGLLFEERACVRTKFLPGRRAWYGFHGILKNHGPLESERVRLALAYPIAESEDICVLAVIGEGKAKGLWGGQLDFKNVYPNEAAVALVPKEALQAIASNSASVCKVLNRSFSYYQEDAEVLRVYESLIRLQVRIEDYLRKSDLTAPVLENAKYIHHATEKISKDGSFEDVIRKHLIGEVQQEAATIVFEGVRFLDAFR